MFNVEMLNLKDDGFVKTEQGGSITKSCLKCIFSDIECRKIAEALAKEGVGDCSENSGYYTVIGEA